MSFSERYASWHGAGDPPLSPMYTDSAQPVAEPSQRVPVERFDVTNVLERIERTLEAMLAATERGNTVAREGAVSSCEIKFLASGVPQPTVKRYTGSEPEIDATLEDYGRVFREAKARAEAGWPETLAELKRGQANDS